MDAEKFEVTEIRRIQEPLKYKRFYFHFEYVLNKMMQDNRYMVSYTLVTLYRTTTSITSLTLMNSKILAKVLSG